MREKTYLEEKDLSDTDKDLVRSLYYENRLLLQDVADLLGAVEAARVYQLKKDIESNSDKMPDPSDIGSIPSDEEALDDIPDDVLEEVRDEENS
jgi:hypothetical protein